MNMKNVVKSFFQILFSFLLFYIVLYLFNHIGFSFIEASFTSSKYNYALAAEIIAFFMIVLFLFLTGKKKIFFEKREGFFKSIGLGVPLLIFIGILSFAGIITLLEDGYVHVPNLIAAFLLCIFIGLFEELLCRGWLLNRFLDKIGKNRKGVLLSIVLSGIVFGSMHFTNILSGQSLFMTIIQVCQTLMIGLVLGILYFRTKNIWALAFLHTFYDFGSFLSDINTLKDCTYNSFLPSSFYIYMISATVIICGFYFFSFLILSRKTKINDLLEEKEELTKIDYDKDERKKLLCSLGMIGIWLLQSIVPLNFDMNDIQVCYSYEKRDIKKGTLSYSNLDSYQIQYSFYKDIDTSHSFENLFQTEEIKNSYLFYQEENTFWLEDTLVEERYAIDTDVLQYMAYEDETRYVIFYTKYLDNNSVLFYLEVPKEEISLTYNLLEFIKNSSISSYVLPDILKIGIYQEENSIYHYPYIVSSANDAFIIDEENELFVLKK